MEEVKEILRILKEVKTSLNQKDYLKIKNLSEEIIHHSSIHQNPDSMMIAVIVYSLSKLIERESYKSYKNWQKFYDSYIQGIDNCIKALEKNNFGKFNAELTNIRKLMENLSGNLKVYIGHVFRKAKINKASRIYEKGISMGKTAEILGIGIWELAEYSGKTDVGDVDLSITMPIKKRIKIAEEIFA